MTSQQGPLQQERSDTPPIVLDTNKFLGDGQYAIVREGTWNVPGKPLLKVAVKRIHLSNVKNNNEEVALKTLNHPNVVKLFDVYSDHDFKFYALELCHASMDQLFKGNEDQKEYHKKMPPNEEVCLQLAQGLAHIHENGLIHRDLKPENVLIWVDSTGKVLMKWADFEQCVPVDENGCYTIIDVSKVGTTNWNAPEILKIQSQKEGNETTQGTVKSDVFSQGLVFGYYILRGRHPYPEENIDQYILDSKPNNLDARQDHPMHAIIMRMLEKDPEMRISSADVVTEITNIVDERQYTTTELMANMAKHLDDHTEILTAFVSLMPK